MTRCFFPALATETEDITPHERLTQRGHGERVLLVEDEAQLADVGVRRLERLGYRAIAETSSPRAVEIMREDPERFDLVITDFSMPRMNGLALSHEISTIKPGLPIILVTGHAEAVTEEEAVAAGVLQVLQKPVTLEQLADAVHRVTAKPVGHPPA